MPLVYWCIKSECHRSTINATCFAFISFCFVGYIGLRYKSKCFTITVSVIANFLGAADLMTLWSFAVSFWCVLRKLSGKINLTLTLFKPILRLVSRFDRSSGRLKFEAKTL